MLCGEKKGIFSSVPKLPAVSLEGGKPSPATEITLFCRKREFRWKGGSCTRVTEWYLRSEPQLQLRIQGIFINLGVAQTKANLKQQPLKVKNWNILYLKPVGKSFCDQPAWGDHLTWAKGDKMGKSSAPIAYPWKDGSELALEYSCQKSNSATAHEKTTSAWHSTGFPKGKKSRCWPQNFVKTQEILQLNTDF